MALFPTVLMLGIAGLDPLGVLIILASLSMKKNKYQITNFNLIVLLGTILLGLGYTTILSTIITKISPVFNRIPNFVYMYIEYILGIFLLLLVIRRTYFKKSAKKDNYLLSLLSKGLPVVAILFVFTSLTDPSFIALMTILSQHNNIFLTIIYTSIWLFISQLPSFILNITILFNKHELVIKKISKFLDKNKRRDKLKNLATNLISLLILIGGILLIANSLYYKINNIWLF